MAGRFETATVTTDVVESETRGGGGVTAMHGAQQATATVTAAMCGVAGSGTIDVGTVMRGGGTASGQRGGTGRARRGGGVGGTEMHAAQLLHVAYGRRGLMLVLVLQLHRLPSFAFEAFGAASCGRDCS